MKANGNEEEKKACEWREVSGQWSVVREHQRES